MTILLEARGTSQDAQSKKVVEGKDAEGCRHEMSGRSWPGGDPLLKIADSGADEAEELVGIVVKGGGKRASGLAHGHAWRGFRRRRSEVSC